ncbi:unnamed protein product (macronuclear) [Paramecium tetraurelia]|uniref:Response regulatory domain-containing protein n=1 Tax=Paramecium tetraurelia TaxID=5888 RepID=A0DQ22_PARTE|nr:uncharacterized protein GSPATT00002539001 [Paramecium tetraurelia]CAK85139.1 unnamed protein product [Paramecium tetraurelia]|eukprot:XP_001452536.1 hypothetical protein (macronuclear) [Paramecium tetraurelia strain d4-2]
MIFYKCKRGIQFSFALKLLITASFSNDIYLIVISSVNIFTILLILNKKYTPIWKYFRIILLLELCFNDQPFGPAIVASIKYNIKYKIIILSYYLLRASLFFFHTFKIIDWIYLGILFVGFNTYFYMHDLKQTDSKINSQSQRKLTQFDIPSQNDSNEVIDFLNYIPLGICQLDSNYNLVNSNHKTKKYCSNIKEDTLQQQLFLMIQRAWIQQQSMPSALRFERRSLFNSSEDYGSDFQLKRMQSCSQSRKKAISFTSCRQYNNPVDIVQIINKYKSKGISGSINLNSLKYRDQTTFKTYEIKIYEVSKGLLIMIKNITKKEKQIDMKERYHFQQMLINSFSHELRTPLNCSLSLLQTLEQQIKSELNDTYLKPAIISNKKLLHQINDILDFANFEVQTFKLRPTIFKLSNLIQTIEDYFKAECEQKKIDFVIQSCEDAFIRSDYDRILQILVNLLNNSVKYTKQEGIIQLNVKRVGSLYQFEVFDTGCGISNEKLFLINKILQNQEVDIARRGEEDYIQYVGLGLKVSSQIARQLCDRGELNITSQLNQFTNNRFVVKDLQSYDEALIIPTDECIQEPYKSKVKTKCNCLNVLIVDDIPFNHLAFITVLKYFNVKSDSAYDGQMAIEMVKNRFKNCKCTYKLIFMDIDMPGIDGYQTTQEIQQFLEQNDMSSTIIMCSAFDSKDNIDIAYKSGMKDILPKPIETSRLKKILYKYYF